MKPYLLLLLGSFLLLGCSDSDDGQISIRIEDKSLHPIDHRLFGQFLEKPSWGGEIGPEAAVDTVTGKLPQKVVEMLKSMQIPVLRFPGGTDVDHLDWLDMIDNAPGRINSNRPFSLGHQGDTIRNYFGYDEALKLAEEIGAEMILVPNFGDAYYGRKPVREAALHAAGLIAYCNAETGTELPAGMPDWPSIRAKNGRSAPYEVRYVQIANEPWVLDRRLKLNGDIDDSLRLHFFRCQQEYIDAIRDVDPEIEIIVDGNCAEIAEHLQEEVGNQAQYAAYHVYYPWQINMFRQDEQDVDPDTLSDQEIWQAWVSFPQIDSAGYSVLNNSVFRNSVESGYPVAVTEWNWNGWWNGRLQKNGVLDSKLAQGIGAAGFLHAFMRQGNQIVMALQSMLIGNSWGITGIRVDPSGKNNPMFFPTGKVTGFYAAYHGDSLLEVSGKNVPHFPQPFKMNGIIPAEKVAAIDFLASKGNGKIYLHCINRSFNQDYPLKLDLGLKVQPTAIVHRLIGPVEPAEGEEFITDSSEELNLKATDWLLTLPAHSITIVEFSI